MCESVLSIPNDSQESHLSYPWWQVPLLAKPSCWPLTAIFFSENTYASLSLDLNELSFNQLILIICLLHHTLGDEEDH